MRRLLIVSLLIFSLFATAGTARADGGRTKQERETYLEYIWIVNGPDGVEFCRIMTEYLERPSPGLIRALCDDLVYKQLVAGDMYLNLLTARELTRLVNVALPSIEIALEVNANAAQPLATITATDPLAGERVTRIEARLGNSPVVCDSSPCLIPLPNLEQATLTYWAESSLGDSTSRHVAMLASIHGNGVEVIGDRTFVAWMPSARVPHLWRVIPPETLPNWLQDAPGYKLYSDTPLYYLAGQIILSGSVGVPDCDNWGIERWSGGYADQCGMEHARSAVTAQQNAYNVMIAQAAQESGVPSRLLKGVISQESQFWPGARGIYGEAGLFQLSRAGADTLLRWSGSQYVAYCDLYFEDCSTLGYDNREGWQQELMISAVMRDANDIALLGEVLTADAAQVTRLLENVAGITSPGDTMSYADLWRITIVNYHAGPDVVGDVLIQMHHLNQEMTWDNFVLTLELMAPGVLAYVHAVTGEIQAEIPLEGVE